MAETGVKGDRGQRARGGLWIPGVVNLALGVPAMIPLYLTWWLLAEYLPMDCHSADDLARAGLANCNYHTLDHAGPVMFLLTVTGLFMLVLVLIVDLLLPLRRGDRLGTWLGTAVLIPVPFMVCMALV
ncbi:hypothetical protein [Streptomyces sp. 8N706]|uniref:hypothetical protein n=1 Tax=Streptomyces sp. 8N706 TaxID=3457416 RepID=UPI003FD26558